jgi:DNA-binding MarR family transcriptional regulator
MTGASRRQAAEQVLADRQAISTLTARHHLGSYLDLDLTLSQLRVVLLVTTGTATTGREIADALRVSAPTVSATVDRLVDLGYLERLHSTTDRRVTRLTVTDRARDLHDRLLVHRDGGVDLLASLDPEDLAALARGTRALRAALEARTATGTTD